MSARRKLTKIIDKARLRRYTLAMKKENIFAYAYYFYFSYGIA